MRLEDKVAVVTGGAHGIGRALAVRFKEEGARTVVVVDQDVSGAKAVAGEIGGVPIESGTACTAASRCVFAPTRSPRRRRILPRFDSFTPRMC